MTLLVTGGTGNTGTLFLNELKKRGYDQEIRCFIERNIEFGHLNHLNLSHHFGDLWDINDVRQAVKDVDTIVHIAGIRMTPNIIEAARESGVRRLIVVSTTGIYSQYNELSQEYNNIEQKIWKSGLDFTILRPTMIYGNLRDHNMHKLIQFLYRYSVFPIFGSGKNLMQPVYIEDLAKTIVNTLDNELTYNKAYDLPGYQALTYKKIIETIAVLLGKKVYQMHIPMKAALYAGLIYNKISSKPIVSYEQILRLGEDKAYHYDDAKKDLNYNPLPFEEGIKREINEMRLQGIIKN